jgi:N-formylglutamate deformylase
VNRTADLGRAAPAWKCSSERPGAGPGIATRTEKKQPVSSLEAELDPPFEILEPAECRGPVVFNSPHSGRIYPRAFLSAAKLDLSTLRRSEDSFVDDLIAGVVARGHPLMRVHFPRCYVDVNREPYELDPRMFDGRLPSFANTRSMRVAGGLGTVARVVGDAQEIYDQRIPIDDALRRIEGLYKPYHRALRRLLTRVHRDFGAAVLVDCHSMPSTAGTKDDRPRADVVLGDRYGTSCVGIVAETIDEVFRDRGYAVSRNKPYAGGFITEHYGNPAAGLHSIQIEINRALYMDERRYERSPSFGKLAADLVLLAERLAEIPLEELKPYRAAAE